jgi:hypothetical protein
MARRADPSGVSLNEHDAAIVKGMLMRGDRQHDIAAYFGVNGGRIGEISTGLRFRSVHPAELVDLPKPGPYLRPADLMKELDEIKLHIANLEARIP